MKQTVFSVRACTVPGRPKLKFVVTGPKIAGKRWRRFFAKKAEAETFMQLRKVERENHGQKAIEFPEALRVEALECVELLKPFNLGLRDAVNMLLPTLKGRSKSCPVEQLVREVRSAKEKDGASKRHLEDLKSRLAVFERDFSGRLAADISTGELDDWLRGLPVGPTGRNNFRKVTRTAFSFAVARGYCATNPVTATARAKVKDAPPGILTVSQAAGLLEHATVELLPYLAIGLFAGLRRAELERLDWREVDLVAGHIEVAAAKSKTARRRLVTVEPNLRDWLAPLARPAGPVAPNNLRRRLAAVREAAGVTSWPENCMRHSFGSYHVAAFGSAAKTALEMGHVNAAMLFGNYREIVKPKEAARYWKIRPASQEPGKIVSITAA